MNPKYPVFIPSKGRADSRLTQKALDIIGVPYYVVVEEAEHDEYAAVTDLKRNKILTLPFSNRGLTASRNWISDKADEMGVTRHWQLDDNIRDFYRVNHNRRIRVTDGTMFHAMEMFSDRYENVAISGPNYLVFAPRRAKFPPFYLNTRVYSCSLIRNELGYRHELFFNDDTDICLRVLKDGWATVLFNAFLCQKVATMRVKGGNTGVYQGDGRLQMAQQLADAHPDVTTVSEKWGRYQHHVNYAPFKYNLLKLRPEIERTEGFDNMGMILEKTIEEKWVEINEETEEIKGKERAQPTWKQGL